MPRLIRRFGCLALIALGLMGSGCKSSTKPAPPAELPNDPNAAAPALSPVGHFMPDTQWIEITPTTDDVEIRDIDLGFQFGSSGGGGWTPMHARLVGGNVIRRNTTGYIEVLSPQMPGNPPIYAAILWLNVRRTAYRTWFHVRVI